jgi:glutathione S-transferase
MPHASLILYHAWSSSASRKVRLCLAEKGLAYESRVMDLLRFQHHSDWYKTLNPSGIVPCLFVDGRALVESNLINEFLDEWRPHPPLMPEDPADRHEVRRLAKYVDDVCLTAVQKPNWSRSMQPVAEKWSDEELEARLAAIPSEGRRALWRRMARDPFTRQEIEAGLDILEDLNRQIAAYLDASGGPWLFGEQLTLADIAVAPYVVRFEEERPGRLAPASAQWWSRFTARPAWRVAAIGAYEDDTARSAREAMADPP